ncbi:MAG: hypothetical protein ABH919_03190 [bacterium]
MSIIFIANLSFVVIASFISLWLGWHVFLSNRELKSNFYFFLVSIFISLWLIFGFLSGLFFQTSLLATIAMRINFAAVALFVASFYFFSLYFPRESKRHPLLDRIVLITLVPLTFLSLFTDLIIKDTEIGKFGDWGSNTIYGSWIEVYHLAVFIFAILAFSVLIKKYFTLSGEDKLRTNYFIIGLGLFCFFNIIFNIIFPVVRGNVQYYQFGDYSAIFIIILTAVAITKKKLFGARIILTSLFVVIISVLLLFDIFFSYQLGLLYTVFKGLIFVLFSVFGYQLIKSVETEIKQKEELSDMNKNLENKVKERTKSLKDERDSLEVRVVARTRELRELNKSLETKVAERTKELNDRLIELEKFHKLTVGREMTMIDLKKKVKKLEEETKNENLP